MDRLGSYQCQANPCSRLDLQTPTDQDQDTFMTKEEGIP